MFTNGVTGDRPANRPGCRFASARHVASINRSRSFERSQDNAGRAGAARVRRVSGDPVAAGNSGRAGDSDGRRGLRGGFGREKERLSLQLKPITHREAAAFVSEHHRHCVPSKGWKFGVGVCQEGELVGVAVVGRPVARLLDDGWTLEVTRLCTTGERNACSILYAAARRGAFALGYRRVVTYTLATEPGSSLRASGFEAVAETRAESWDRPGRKRSNAVPICPKTRWQALAA